MSEDPRSELEKRIAHLEKELRELKKELRTKNL